MTTKQKIWLGVFLAMFLVPEILWGPITGLFFRYTQIHFLPIFKDVQLINDNSYIMNTILLIEFLSFSGIFIFLGKISSRQNIWTKIVKILIFFLLLYLAFITFFYNSLDKMFS